MSYPFKITFQRVQKVLDNANYELPEKFSDRVLMAECYFSDGLTKLVVSGKPCQRTIKIVRSQLSFSRPVLRLQLFDERDMEIECQQQRHYMFVIMWLKNNKQAVETQNQVSINLK